MEKINKQRITEYLFYLFCGGIILFICLNTTEAKKLLNYVLSVLSPFIYGFCFAFIINLISKQFDKSFVKLSLKRGKEVSPKKYRIYSILISLLILIAFLALSIGLIIPNLRDTVVKLYNQAPELWEKLMDLLDSLKTKQPKLAKYITAFENNIDVYYEKFFTWFKSNLSNLAGTALSKIKSISNVVVNGGIGIVIAFAILLNKEWLKKEFYAILNKLLPKKHYKRAKYVLSLANKKFQIYFKYNLIQALITGAGTFIIMLVTAMPYKISISLLITVTQLIPIIGAIIGTAVGALLIAADNPIKALVFVVLCIVIQQIVEKLINPHLIGKELDMPGVITFLAIIIGGKQFGLVGLICSVPIVSLFYDIYKLKIRPRIYEKSNNKEE